jgi:transposase
MTKRNYKEGIDRQQSFLLPPSVDEYVSADNPVRAIDTYVDSLDLEGLGFKHAGGELAPGQPAFPPTALLKLYLYGYLHRVRSSRRLEAECVRNLEVIWLMEGLRPGYKTIADFRKDNLKALQQVNRDFVQLCKELDLFGGELVGIDGSFFRGNVAKKSIYTAERLKRALKHIEQDIAKYLHQLERADQQEGQPSQADPALGEKLKQLHERQKKRTEQLQQLEESGEKQIAEVDEDARLLSKKGHGTIAGYNVQTAVDDKYKLIVTGEVTQDGNDEQQLAPMSQAAKAELGVERLTSVEDQGYFNAQQIKECQEEGITPYVPEPDKQAQTRQPGRLTRDDFHYDAQTNCYTCPAGKELKFSTSIDKQGKRIWIYRSSVPVCASCPLKGRCLPRKTTYRAITRWEHEAILEAHRERMKAEGAEKMRQRAQLCEHPFGTLKLWLGWTHFLLRGLKKVRAEFTLMMLAYNFRRVLTILGLEAFRSYCLNRRVPRPAMSG